MFHPLLSRVLRESGLENVISSVDAAQWHLFLDRLDQMIGSVPYKFEEPTGGAVFDESNLIDARPTVLCLGVSRERMSRVKMSLETRFHVRMASDDRKLVDLMKTGRVDVILYEPVAGKSLDVQQLRQFREDSLRDDIPLIVLTASQDPEERLKAIEIGVDDYVARPVSEKELQERLYQRVKKRLAHQRNMKELSTGGRVQRGLMPSGTVCYGDVQLSALFWPSGILSGDFFDIRFSEGWVYFYLADVSGQDHGAAQVTLLLKELFQGALDFNGEIGLVELLRWIAGKYSAYRIENELAIQIGRYCLKDRRLEYVRANAPSAFKVQIDQETQLALSKAGPAISGSSTYVFDPAQFQVSVDILKPGEAFYLVSDGAHDLRTMSGSVARKWLADVLAKTPLEHWQDYLLDVLSEINGGRNFRDDLTILRLDVLEFKKALIVAEDVKLAKMVRAQLETCFPEFKLLVTSELGRAINCLEDRPIDAVFLQDVPLESLPIERKFATLLLSNRPNVKLDPSLQGKVDLVFSEPIEPSDLVEAIKKPSLQREKQWRRTVERVSISVPIKLDLNGIGGNWPAELINIGTGGMFVAMMDAPPAIGEKIEFKLKYGWGAGNLAGIEGMGVVRWVRPSRVGAVQAGCGVQFSSLTELSIRNLKRILVLSRNSELVPLF